MTLNSDWTPLNSLLLPDWINVSPPLTVKAQLSWEPLEIKTAETFNNGDKIYFTFYDKIKGYISEIKIEFNSGHTGIKFWIGWCGDKWRPMDKQPSNPIGVWKFFKTRNSWKFWCNDELVVDFNFLRPGESDKSFIFIPNYIANP